MPFPVGVGDTWTYKTTYGKTINRMTAVTAVSGRQQVTMSSAITSLGNTSNDTAYYVIHSDGSVQPVQTVTVPAGTYNATVVNMTMAETVHGFAVSDEVRTWLATGVGPVKTEVILDEAGVNHVEAENRLVSFKAG